MVAPPHFTHIHCSSRYDRSAATLESDLDDWMAKSSIVTLTEINNDRRAQTMREKGWDYYNGRQGGGQDECGIAWSKAVWHHQASYIRRLTNSVFYKFVNGQPDLPIYSVSVMLRNVNSGHRLLMSVTHFPAHVEGFNHTQWNTDAAQWQARKRAYLEAMHNWSTHIKDLDRKHQPDAALVCADFNLNLKHNWVRDMIASHWGKTYHQGWVRFPTVGGSNSGGPVAPLGAPGVDTGDRIIDGSLYHHLKVTEDPNLMQRVRSSDHRPYKETFRFLSVAEHPDTEQDPPSGDVKPGKAWWGFGDYLTDEIYAIDRVRE